MTQPPLNGHRAADYEAVVPLIDLCRAGHLFDVQAWITAGKPVNPPPPPVKGRRPPTPLETAIKCGFHSMVQVLLEAGAIQEPTGYDAPIYQAMRARRFDLVQLLVDHGFDAKSIDMRQVFATWEPQIMEYFISRGADVHSGEPFAVAFCNRIRTALRVYKRCRDQMPELQKQADIALRHHCAEGNLKWVSLMLWAGADPFALGSDRPSDETDEDNELWSAVGLAALFNHYEVFNLKPIKARLPGPNPAEFVRHLTSGDGVEVLKSLLERGLNPNDQADGGCSAISPCLQSMSWDYVSQSLGGIWGGGQGTRKADTPRARQSLKAIHLLAKHGAKWKPTGKGEIESARRSLLKLIPDYTIELIWIMSKYQACTLEAIKELLRTSSMKSHTVAHQDKLMQLFASFAPNQIA